MRSLVIIALAATAAFVEPTAGLLRTFEDDRVGAPPSGIVSTGTRQATLVPWVVTRQGDNSVLSYTGPPGSGKGASLAVLDSPGFEDLSIAVRLRLVGGDRQGGVVWRYKDVNNHYLARLDLKEQKIGLYRVVHGNRIRIEGTDDLELDQGAWHVLKALHDRDRIRVYLGGIKVFDVRDRIFAGAGGVGLWASPETVGHFDDVRVEDKSARKP